MLVAVFLFGLHMYSPIGSGHLGGLLWGSSTQSLGGVYGGTVVYPKVLVEHMVGPLAHDLCGGTQVGHLVCFLDG